MKVEKTLHSANKKDTGLSNATREEKIEVAAANEEDSTMSSETSEALPLNVVHSDKPSEVESHVNGELVVEENPQPALVPQPITAEH